MFFWVVLSSTLRFGNNQYYPSGNSSSGCSGAKVVFIIKLEGSCWLTATSNHSNTFSSRSHPSCVPHNSSMCAAWIIHICLMTHSYVWQDSLIFAIWCIRTCDMTDSYVRDMTDSLRSSVRHDSFMCATWLTHMCEMTPPYVRHDWLIHVCNMTNSYVRQDSTICAK